MEQCHYQSGKKSGSAIFAGGEQVRRGFPVYLDKESPILTLDLEIEIRLAGETHFLCCLPTCHRVMALIQIESCNAM